MDSFERTSIENEKMFCFAEKICNDARPKLSAIQKLHRSVSLNNPGKSRHQVCIADLHIPHTNDELVENGFNGDDVYMNALQYVRTKYMDFYKEWFEEHIPSGSVTFSEENVYLTY